MTAYREPSYPPVEPAKVAPRKSFTQWLDDNIGKVVFGVSGIIIVAVAIIAALTPEPTLQQRCTKERDRPANEVTRTCLDYWESHK